MMENYDWKFSSEVQLDLLKYMKAVERRKVSNNTREILQQLLPQEFQCEIINEDPVHSQLTTNESDVIIIDDDDDEESSDIKETSKILSDLSVLNSVEEAQENLSDPDLHDFIEYIQETIENQGSLLKANDIKKLQLDYNELDLLNIFTEININISEQGINNLGQSIISYDNLDISKIVKQFCKNILLVKLQNTELTQTLQLLLKGFLNTFSSIARTELLIPLLQTNPKFCNIYISIINLLSESEKEYMLRDFIFSCSELEVWQLSPLQLLISMQTEESVKRRLINLMDVSADKFKQEMLFLKLLVTIIQNLGKGFEDQEQVLGDLIEKNTTLLKNSARKALQEWKNVCTEA